MNKVLRWLLRILTAVLALAAVLLVLASGFWYTWKAANDSKPETPLTLTASEMEQWAIGLYIRQAYGDKMNQPADPDDTRERTFVIESGETAVDVSQRLERVGLVSDADLFRRVVQYWGADGDIQAGVFLLSPSMTMEQIVKSLQNARQPSVRVTILEGWRMEEIAAELEEQGVVSADAFLSVARGQISGHPLVDDRPTGSPASLEGYLFPDTYDLPLSAQPEDVIDILLTDFEQRVPDDIAQRAADSGRTVYEVLTLASIVEREAVLPDEQPLIAGVYTKRMSEDMYLQSDPTVQYAKGYDATAQSWWTPMLQEEAITVVSPYNTFLNPGLPPGPICNPGLGAIEAALSPEETDYLFFYAKGDGSHVFAETYEEHLENETLYGGGDGEGDGE